MRETLRQQADGSPLALMAALMGIHLVVAVLAFDPAPHAGGDNTAYLALARSLLDHGRLLELWDPARPIQTQYPPGFPVILAVAGTLGLRSWFALKSMMLLFSATAVGLSYLWMRRRTEPTVALGLGFLLAVAPGIVGESGWVLSDVPFWAATMGALLAAAHRRTGWAVALAFVALSLRTAGLPLLVAMAAWMAWRREWRVALGVVVALVAVQVLWGLRAPDLAAPYVSQFWLVNPYVPEAGRVGVWGLLERMVENGGRYGFRILMRMLTGAIGVVAAVGGVALVAFAGMGFSLRVRRGRIGEGDAERDRGAGLVEIFSVLYVAMLLLWPEPWASDRFLMPLVPVILVYAAEGLRVLPGAGLRRPVRVGALLALLGLGIPSSMALLAGAARCRADVRAVGVVACRQPAHQAFLELAQWARGRLPDDAIVLSRKPRQWYWFSGYPGRVYPFSRDPSRLVEAARAQRARYVVLDELGGTARAYLVPAVTENRQRFCAIQRIQRGGQAATLMGVLPVPWDPEVYGLEGDAGDTNELRLPICPPAYLRSDG